MSLYETELEYQVTEFNGPRKRMKRVVQTSQPLEKWTPYMFSKIQDYLGSLQKTKCEVNIINSRSLGPKGAHEEVKS